ncbi:HD domain-containing phosphohydrolase [Floridanema aerugineum]|jgi:HD-GYP domain-containing protein (c-di-GMP phosphodiesterase class II)|uniref:HD domain-containing phosphohydrolase n=1 Tax=Floridaenema aerugineum BLCC-F46 TaxID=3153654 RepID=A0ABV4WY20_9CYAN
MIFLDGKLYSLPQQEKISETGDRVELIEQLLAIGTALSSSQDLGELLNLILSKSREITCSDAGSLYLIDQKDNIPKLIFKAAQNDSLPQATFKEFAMQITQKSLAGYVALTGKSLNLPDAYNLPKEVTYQIDKTFDESFAYRTRSVLVLPMQDQKGEIIGVIQLINRKIKRDIAITFENAVTVTKPYSDWEERIVRSLASQAAISIERNQLQESIQNLFAGFVKASVHLIELRDPTTSGHSERVAELTVRLSEEVSSITSGKFKSIYFNDSQIQEIRYAALLHDFGKVCVPERILQKRKKLYPEQLDLLRHRFALAQRSLELECAETKFKQLFKSPFHRHEPNNNQLNCPHCDRIEKLDTELQLKIAKLNRYWKILLEINEPEAIETKQFQALSEEALIELTELSEYKYRDIDGQLKPLVSLEEMEQLMIPRGNLTPEERKAIEAHVIHTYKFLEQIPWTKDLKQVPLIAAFHHEKLDGSGYPHGLETGEIPLQTQILTIADIYDALTASDRPYKRKLPVETTLQILKQEAHKGKLNTDLVELFHQRQVFQVLGQTLSID